MRSITFIQYFSVIELIRIKLLHSQLNQIINQEWIKIAIQIGNLSEFERNLYWISYPKYDIEIIKQIWPIGMINLINNNNEPTLFIIKSCLFNNIPDSIKSKDEHIFKIIAQMMIKLQLHRIFIKSNYQSTKQNLGIDMMVFTLEKLISKYCGISLKDDQFIFAQCFSTLLINIASNHQDILIKLIESFSIGGWNRI